MAKTFTVDTLTPTIGATVHDIDLNECLDSDSIEQIYDLLLKNLVLFFPDQEISPETHLAFAESFGDLDKPHHVYPSVPGYERIVLLEHGGDQKPNTDVWHSDLTLRQKPPFASILYSKAVPKTGGDTLWASMYAAYDALPEHIRKYLEDLSAIHSMGSYWNEYYEQGGIERINEAMADMGAALHPIVMRHPATGRRFLFVNRHFTVHVLGMSSGDSQRLLGYLFDHIEQPQFQVRYRWKSGVVAMWDNRVTQHYAVKDYLPEYRCMHRVTVVEDKRTRRIPG